MRRLAFFVTVCVFLGLALVWAAGSILTHATNSAEIAAAPPAQMVFIDSAPPIRLAGSYWDSPTGNAPAVLMLHGNGSNRASLAESAAWLNKNGYAVLTIDFRGHGQSSPATKSFGLYESEDACAAFDWLKRKHPNARIGVIGFSLGGAASVLGKDGPLPADAIVLEGVYPDIRHAIFNRLALRLGKGLATIIEPMLSYQSLFRFGVWPSAMSPLRALSMVREPVLIVGGGNDENTPPAETRAMFEAVKDHGELLVMQGASHAELGRTMPAPLKSELLQFLRRNLEKT